MPRVSRLPALSSPPFRRYFSAQIVSAIGSQMQFAALNWHVYSLTHSPLALGGIGLVRVVPILLFSLLGGAAADAGDRRRLLLITQSMLALVAAVLGVVTLTGHANAAWIYALSAVGAAAIAFDNPARQSLIPSLVPREHLPNAITLGSTGMQVATIMGPAIAGLVMHKVGPGGAYIVNAFSFLTVIAALWTLPPTTPATDDSASAPRFSPAAFVEGLAFVRATPILWQTMLVDFFATLFASASALLPVVAHDILHIDERGYGLLSSTPAIGSVLAGGSLAFLPPIRRQGLVLLCSIAVFGLATIGFGFATTFAVAAVFLALTGAADTVSTVIRNVIRQTVTPDRLRGRMVAVSMIFFMGGPQLGELEAGVVAQAFGTMASVVSGGALCIVTAIAFALSPILRERRDIDHDTPGPVKAA